MSDLMNRIRRYIPSVRDRENCMPYWFRRFRTSRIFTAGLAAAFAILPIVVWAGTPLNTGQIRIYGNDKIKSYIIRREIRLKTGEPFDRDKVEQARRRISEIPGVDYSEIRVFYTPVDSSLALNVVVTEQSAFAAFPIIQRGYENIFGFGAWVADDNFRGRSEKIGASFLLRGGTVVTAGWENPWLGQGPRIGIGAGGKYAYYRYVYDDFDGVFEGTRISQGGVDGSFLYTFGTGTRVFTRLGYELADADREGATIKPDGDKYGTISLGIKHDGRSSALFPWSGWYLSAEAIGIGPGDDAYSITEGRLDTRLFLPVFNRTVLGLQVTANVKEGDEVPIYLREHLGGGLTIRSYDYGSFNGVSSILTSAEFRIPFNFSRDRTVEDLLFGASLHFFYDGGATWELNQSLNKDAWQNGFGLGIMLMNPWIRGFRFDYGWNRDSNRGHFEIGAKF